MFAAILRASVQPIARKFVPAFEKPKYSYGNTQIAVSPYSSAALSLNMARGLIWDAHLMAAGKDVDPNHVTVRYGLLNDDLDGLRSFLAHQTPFEAVLGDVELFPASEHSDGAVPVVARIFSPELHAIEAEIGKHADFKDKSFPDYKPHCTLAYVKPEYAPTYATLPLAGRFLVQSITISHRSGVQETIPFGMTQKRQWDESKHPRNPRGSSAGGEFTSGARDALDSLFNEEHVSIDPRDVRRLLEMAAEHGPDPGVANLMHLHVEGMEIFDRKGLGIDRELMPQIPKDHRFKFLQWMEQEGVRIEKAWVNPLDLMPTQDQISATNVGEKLAKYEKDKNRKFPPVLVSKEGRILDGHHHWGMMAAFAIEFPNAKMPVYRFNVGVQRALALMHTYMKANGLKRKSATGEEITTKWEEDDHPRDAEGQFARKAVEAAIRRGEAHKVSENDFVNYHVTGSIPSDAYERYEAGDLDFVKRKDFDTLLSTHDINGQTVEIRLQAEPVSYSKYTVAASDEERDRLYAEYEEAAKKLGTTPMMAGIDLGHGSDAYNELGKFEQRWLRSGSELVRDTQGLAVKLTPEEVQAHGLPGVSYTVGAFVGDKAIGYAGDEFGASGVYLAREYQRHGLGLELIKTYLEKSGRLATGRQIGQMTPAGRALVRALHRQLVKEAAAKETRKADPVSGRYVTPFVSFDKQGDDALRMIASLNSSRLATWGFTAEAEVLGMARYRLTAVLDGRTSKFCRLMDGKIFDVADARRKVIEALNVQNPEDLKVVQPWPKQTKADMEMYAKMSTEEFVARGLHIPPFHPFCRTLLRHVPSSEGDSTEPPVATLEPGTEVFQAVTAEDLKELGIDATPEDVAAWNANIAMTPVEMLTKLTGMTPQDVMIKGKGVGANPINFDPNGIGIKARGENTNGVEFRLGAILDPFTGIFYLTQADLMAGTPKAELAFLRNLFTELISAGLKTSATALAIGAAGNAAYFAKLGFLPDELEWDSIRTFALSEIDSGALKVAMESLDPTDQLLVKQLLQDSSASALTALVELPFYYEGKSIGEWILEDSAGTWALDLTDDVLVAQAKAYLS